MIVLHGTGWSVYHKRILAWVCAATFCAAWTWALTGASQVSPQVSTSTDPSSKPTVVSTSIVPPFDASTPTPVELPVVTVEVPLQLPPPPPGSQDSDSTTKPNSTNPTTTEPSVANPGSEGTASRELDSTESLELLESSHADPATGSVSPELPPPPESLDSPDSTNPPESPSDASRIPTFPVVFTQAQSVYAPSEWVSFRLGPFPPEAVTDGSIRLTWSVTLVDPLSHQVTARALETGEESFLADGATHPVSVPLGDQEGVYEIRLDVTAPGGILRGAIPMLTHTLRIPAVSSTPTLPDTGRTPANANQAKSITRRYTRTGQSRVIDPLCAGMAVVLATYEPTTTSDSSFLPEIPSLSNLRPTFLRSREKEDETENQNIDSENENNSENASIASTSSVLPKNRFVNEYSLERLIPGTDHWIEILCPNDVSRQIALRITTPETTTTWGVQDSRGNWETTAEGRHSLRFLFRPSATTATLTLIVQTDSEQPHTNPTVPNESTILPFEQIRVLAAPDGIALPARTVRSGRRLILADLPDPDSPSFAGLTTGPDDWNAILTSGVAMTEMLRFARYDGLIRTVRIPDFSTAPFVSTVSPTSQNSPNQSNASILPRVTSSLERRDPEIRDTAELWLRLFDREGFMLVLRPEWTIPPSVTSHNPLDSTFRTAILNQAREIASRYANHPSFGGVALDLSTTSGLRFSGPADGLDSTTRARFAQETGFADPNSLTGTESEWLTWRSEQITRFYDQLADVLRQSRPEARLWLVGYNPEENADGRTPLDAGLAAERFAQDPRYFSEIPTAESTVPATEGNGMAIGSAMGERFTMVPPPFPESQKSEPLKLRPVGDLSVQNLAQHWAQRDIRIYCDSPFQSVFRYEITTNSTETALRSKSSEKTIGSGIRPEQGDPTRRLRTIFRDFPTLCASRFVSQSPSEGQPVVLRACCDGRSTWIAAINTAPFTVQAQIRLVASESVAAESPLNTIVPSLRFSQGRQIWEITLPGNTAETLRLASPDVLIEDYTVVWSETTDAEFQRQIRQLSAQIHELARPSETIPLTNPQFVTSRHTPQLSGWRYFPAQTDHRTSLLRRVHGPQGEQWLRLTGEETPQTLVSDPFTIPQSGRIMIGLRLRAVRTTTETSAIPQIRLGVETPQSFPQSLSTAINFHSDTNGNRGTELDAEENAESPQVGAIDSARVPFYSTATFDDRDYQYDWNWLVVQVTDLPQSEESESPQSAQLRIELTGPGSVEFDEVRLSGLVLTRQEQATLFKQIVPAGTLWSQRRVSDCLAILNRGVTQWKTDVAPQLAFGNRTNCY